MTSDISSSFKTSSSSGEQSDSSIHKWYRGIRILCSSLVILCILTTIFQICAIIMGGKFSEISAGIWCGALYAVTGIYGYFNADSRHKAKMIGLTAMGAISCFASLALIALASLSLTSQFPIVIDRSLDPSSTWALWISSNAILIGLGVLGFLINLVLTFIIGLNMQQSEAKQVLYDDGRDVMEMTNEELVEPPHSYPQSEIVAVIKSKQMSKLVANESLSSKNSSGFYEIFNSEQPSTQQQVDKALPAQSINMEPIYVLPVKNDKPFSAAGDFEIEIDTRQDSPISRKKYFTNIVYEDDSSLWYAEYSPEQQTSAKIDSDGQENEKLSRNIQLPKEDVIIHAAPKDNTRQS